MEKHEAFLCPFCGAPYRELIPAGTVQVRCHYCGATVLVPPRLGGLLQLCPNHPESLALGICTDCGRSFCADCLFIFTYGQRGYLGYLHVCSDCIKKRRENQKIGLIAVSILTFLWGFFIMGTGASRAQAGLGVIVGLVIILAFHALSIIAYSHSSKRFKRLPTVRIVMEKVSELNKRAEEVKAAMSPQEVEDLYRRLLIPDPHTGKVEYSKIDQLLKKYMQSGLSRKEAILKMASEEELEIKPGLHIPPTISDALSELKKEMKKVESAKEEIKISEKAGELYEQLLYAYTAVYGGGRQALEREIKSLMEQGFSREEAIYNLAEKERLIEKV